MQGKALALLNNAQFHKEKQRLTNNMLSNIMDNGSKYWTKGQYNG